MESHYSRFLSIFNAPEKGPCGWPGPVPPSLPFLSGAPASLTPMCLPIGDRSCLLNHVEGSLLCAPHMWKKVKVIMKVKDSNKDDRLCTDLLGRPFQNLQRGGLGSSWPVLTAGGRWPRGVGGRGLVLQSRGPWGTKASEPMSTVQARELWRLSPPGFKSL